jgi:hypothetical protein
MKIKREIERNKTAKSVKEKETNDRAHTLSKW